MDSGVFGDAIVRQRMTVYQLFTGKDEPLLVGRHLLLHLDGQPQIFHRRMGSHLGKKVLLGTVRITNDKVY